MLRPVLVAVLLLLVGACASPPPPPALPDTPAVDQIRLNQLGFYPDAPKTAVVVGADEDESAFRVVRTDDGATVLSGSLAPVQEAPLSGEQVRRADFSDVTAPGAYVLVVEGIGRSYPFVVAPAVHGDLARAAVKGYTFQRASAALDEALAGPWRRAAGHPDDRVLVHASAASPERPEGTVLSAPKGWYDAGDYNKYIVNSGVTMGTLLMLYEQFPAFTTALDVDLPERGGPLPDVLDEALWNLRWMLAMQDPNDGGVYHKLTTADFEGAVMPEAARAQRYVVQKSTAATLDFAAVMARAARVYGAFPEAVPGLADSARAAALDAWRWARAHPDRLYQQRELNARYEPDVVTGAYGDGDVTDEFAWAAAELFATTGADSFLTVARAAVAEPLPPLSWSQVRPLAAFTLSDVRDRLPADLAERARARVLERADRLVEAAASSAYGTPMGTRREDFIWGSSSVAGNQGVTLLQAYRLTDDPAYAAAALANLDYLLGRNATGYSFVTGYGDRTPMHPHHRPSEADAVEEPVPGLLAGGPNPGQQDDCTYPSPLPAKSYVDSWCSYASNEIAINWNAPLVYLTVALEALAADGALAPR